MSYCTKYALIKIAILFVIKEILNALLVITHNSKNKYDNTDNFLKL